MSLLQAAVVITTPAGEPTGVVACIGDARTTEAAVRLLESHVEHGQVVIVTGGDQCGPQAIVIQCVEEGWLESERILHVCQTWADARRWLAEWYKCDGGAAKPIAVDWVWPRLSVARSARRAA